MMKIALLAAAVGGLLAGLPGTASAATMVPKKITTSKATDVTFWRRRCDPGASGFYGGFYDRYDRPYYSGFYGDGFYGYSGFYDTPYVAPRRIWRRDRAWRRHHRPSIGVGVTY